MYSCNGVLKFIAHSKKVLKIASEYGWFPGARYTNLRDIRDFDLIGFIDIEWKNYDYNMHLKAVKETHPILTVAQDIVNIDMLNEILDQAYELSEHAQHVIVVPKDIRLCGIINNLIPDDFLLGYSVPTKYAGTDINPKEFTRPVHLLGGRPDIQINLSNKMEIFSFDCNRFTLDAAYGYYFNGHKFVRNTIGGYENCLRKSLYYINEMWDSKDLIKRGEDLYGYQLAGQL